MSQKRLRSGRIVTNRNNNIVIIPTSTEPTTPHIPTVSVANNTVTPLMSISFPQGFGPRTTSSPDSDCTIVTPSYSSITVRDSEQNTTRQSSNLNMSRRNSPLPSLGEAVNPDMPVNRDGLTLEQYVSAAVGAARANIMREVQSNLSEIRQVIDRSSTVGDQNSYRRSSAADGQSYQPPRSSNRQQRPPQQQPPQSVNLQQQHVNQQQQQHFGQQQQNVNQLPQQNVNQQQQQLYEQQQYQQRLDQQQLFFMEPQRYPHQVNQQPQYFHNPQNMYPPYLVQHPSNSHQNLEHPQLMNQNVPFGEKPMHPNELQKWGLQYDGTNRSYTVEDFVFRVETLKNNFNCSWDVVMKGFHHLVTGNASAWFWSFRMKYPVCEWNVFKTHIIQKFRNFESDFEIQRKIMERRQLPNESADTFISEIFKLKNQMRIHVAEYELVRIVKDNLKDGLAQLIFPIKIDSLDQLLEECKRAERNISKRSNRPVMPNYRRVNEMEFNEYLEDEPEFQLEAFKQDKLPAKQLICWNCKAAGHSFIECPVVQRSVFCYKCGFENVTSPTCP